MLSLKKGSSHELMPVSQNSTPRGINLPRSKNPSPKMLGTSAGKSSAGSNSLSPVRWDTGRPSACSSVGPCSESPLPEDGRFRNRCLILVQSRARARNLGTLAISRNQRAISLRAFHRITPELAWNGTAERGLSRRGQSTKIRSLPRALPSKVFVFECCGAAWDSRSVWPTSAGKCWRKASLPRARSFAYGSLRRWRGAWHANPERRPSPLDPANDQVTHSSFLAACCRKPP